MSYKILDEIEPVKQDAWALHPQLAFWGSMVLATHWLALLGCVNSFLLGHPRRKHHVAISVAALMGVWSIFFLCDHYAPRGAIKYLVTGAIAIHLWLGYYLTEEQEWAAEMFVEAGGKLVGLFRTIFLVRVLGRILLARLRGR
jgi:hypothetical protein